MLFPATVPTNITSIRRSIERLVDMAIASVSSFFLQPGLIIASAAAKRPYSTSNGILARS
jgi:hypothetical protein